MAIFLLLVERFFTLSWALRAHWPILALGGFRLALGVLRSFYALFRKRFVISKEDTYILSLEFQ